MERWKLSQKLLYRRIPQFLAKRLRLRIHMLNVPTVVFFPRHIRKINNEKEILFPPNCTNVKKYSHPPECYCALLSKPGRIIIPSVKTQKIMCEEYEGIFHIYNDELTP